MGEGKRKREGEGERDEESRRGRLKRMSKKSNVIEMCVCISVCEREMKENRQISPYYFFFRPLTFSDPIFVFDLSLGKV